MDIRLQIERLINFAVEQEMLTPHDIVYTRNQYYSLLELEHEQADKNLIVVGENLKYPDSFLNGIYAYLESKPKLMLKLGLNKDMVLCNLMNRVTPNPREVVNKFNTLLALKGINFALDYFYRLSVASNYIKALDIEKNQHWLSSTPYGNLEITINLSKPEKDPKEIALAKTQLSNTYPKCLLCVENEGFPGDHLRPSRHTHRLIPLTLNQQQWYFQYSPYVYYNQHSIILNNLHQDMQINADTFIALFDFVDIVPDYIIGANTDIPIVGGSILNHDHFQAGRHSFPMDNAPVQQQFRFADYPQVKAGTLYWPLSIIRLQGGRADLTKLGSQILNKWINYTNNSVGIINFTDSRHNALNPIVRKINDNLYQLDLVLRNNRKNDAHPNGIFHPHQHLHHIKKENIGLIEAMGLAILPGRLLHELELIGQILLSRDRLQIDKIDSNHQLYIHKVWIEDLYTNSKDLTNKNIKLFLNNEVGKKFMQVLECSGVFKNSPEGQTAFTHFLNFADAK